MELFENIPVDLDVAEVKRRLRLKSDEQSEQIQALIDVAIPLISARATYKVAYIDEKGGGILKRWDVSFRTWSRSAVN